MNIISAPQYNLKRATYASWFFAQLAKQVPSSRLVNQKEIEGDRFPYLPPLSFSSIAKRAIHARQEILVIRAKLDRERILPTQAISGAGRGYTPWCDFIPNTHRAGP
jgi:hypothetical protein